MTEKMGDDSKLFKIFFPYALRRARVLEKKKRRFVHYSSAEAAIKMITNREVWMRKATCMNDFSEIDYGLWCLRTALFRTAAGTRLRQVLDGSFSGLFDEIVQYFARDWGRPPFLEETYLTCLSEHRPCENDLGRLSMWRAYGGATGVAVVMTPTPFLRESHALMTYVSPVGYFAPNEFHKAFANVVEQIDTEQSFLRGIGRDVVCNRLFNAFLFAATCTKHPGFREELEWRVTYHPKVSSSVHLRRNIETIRGVPQLIYKIPLRNIPAQGLIGIEIPELVERVIIGPTQHPSLIHEAFVKTLAKAGVSNASDRVFTSNIPLRQ